MLTLIGFAMVSTATRHRAHSVICRARVQHTLPARPTSTRRCYQHALLTHTQTRAWQPPHWD